MSAFLGIGFMATQSFMQLWLRVTLGIFFLIGVLTMVTDLFTLRPAKKTSA